MMLPAFEFDVSTFSVDVIGIVELEMLIWSFRRIAKKISVKSVKIGDFALYICIAGGNSTGSTRGFLDVGPRRKAPHYHHSDDSAGNPKAANMKVSNNCIMIRPYFKIQIASSLELTGGLAPGATVEAEYGDTVIEGKFYTLAHHGEKYRHMPAPCELDNQSFRGDIMRFFR